MKRLQSGFEPERYVGPPPVPPGLVEAKNQEIAELKESIKTYERFLQDLLVLEPSLERFRSTAPWRLAGEGEDGYYSFNYPDWDYQGVRDAVAFKDSEKKANKYLQPEAPQDAKPEPGPGGTLVELSKYDRGMLQTIIDNIGRKGNI